MPAVKKDEPVEKVLAIKGFDKNLKCRDFQFEVGKTFKHDGPVKACKSGFHAIEGHPLEVFGYYAPDVSVFHEVEMTGPFSRESSDSKIASAEITIKAELKIPEIVNRAIKWVFDQSKPEDGGHATGTRGAASATGYQGAASATGDQGAAMASGFEGRASGKDGNALFLVERETWNGPIISVWAGVVGADGIKADVFYTLKAGKPVEVVS